MTTPLLPSRQLIAYGALGLPLAFAALPLYVHLVPFYAESIPLALLGILLLALRFFDAVIDPLLGVLLDRFPHPRGLIALSLPLLGVGWMGLFVPQRPWPPIPWLLTMLTLTTVGYSLATVVHNAWAARLCATAAERARLFASREAFGLAGVVLAASLPTLLAPTLSTGLTRTGPWFLLLLIALGGVTLLGTQRTVLRVEPFARTQWLRPFAQPLFRRFAPGYLLSAVASALPASLVFFFIDDVLQMGAWAGLFLALYFIAGAAGLPLWMRLVHRIGLFDAWLLSMVLAIFTFASAFTLGAGDGLGYALICVASGVALGADLALPSALVAEMVDVDQGSQPGLYYGLMSFLAKLALALAAGLALPLLDLWGYQPGGEQLWPLSFAYALLPCLLKLAALAWFRPLRRFFATGGVTC
jgi:GPH family glycoside/pentoside/hexuronide:cation symporter